LLAEPSTPSPTVTPIPTTCADLIGNGGFEENGDWIFLDTPNQARYTWSAQHSGRRSVELGLRPGTANQVVRTPKGGAIDAQDIRKLSEGGVYSVAYQSLHIPADLETATLTFWHWLGTEDDDGDWQRVTLISPSNYHVIAEPLNALEHNDRWQHLQYDLTPYRGADALLYLEVFNDLDDDETWMYIDEMSLEICWIVQGA
jgi:hypothetical protein